MVSQYSIHVLATRPCAKISVEFVRNLVTQEDPFWPFFLVEFAQNLVTSTYISTLSALTPHGSVASSRAFCITWLIVSRSDRISARFFVPKTFRRVVAARRRVEWLKVYLWCFFGYIFLEFAQPRRIAVVNIKGVIFVFAAKEVPREKALSSFLAFY